MIRASLVLVIAVTLSVSGALGLTRDDADVRDPVVTGSGPAVVPAGQDLDTTITSLQARLRDVPADAPSWANLALAYVEKARVSGDPSRYAKAEAAVRRSLAAQPRDNAPALAADAALAAARHDFSAALELADRALLADPFSPGALATRVDALTELGRYGDQMAALRQADRRQPGLPITTRYSYAYELRGDVRRAAAMLRRASSTPVAADRTFALTLLADLERRQGRLDRAAAHLRDALRASPGNVPTLASRARLAVARGDLAEAARIWERVVTLLPLPEYLTELGEVHLARGDRQAARTQFGVVRATHQLLAANDVDVDLESALFEADHGDAEVALASARAEWSRRHSIHVADVLAWALHQTGDDRKAIRYARLATRLGTAEGRLWLHRGTIEAALGNDGAAVASLRRGLAADPGQSPWQTGRAREILRTLEGRS